MTATREPPAAAPAVAAPAVGGLRVAGLGGLATPARAPGDDAAPSRTSPAAAPLAPAPRPPASTARHAAEDLPGHSPGRDAALANALGAGTVWDASVGHDLVAQVERWEAAGLAVPTVFQSAAWLRDWADTLGRRPGTEPLVLHLRAPALPTAQLLLPLVRTRQAGLRLLASPDDGVSDYHAPLLAPALDRLGTLASASLWQAVCDALAPHGDVLRLRKQLPVLPDGRANPLASAPGSLPSDLAGERFLVDDDWDAWFAGLPRQARREARRHERLFSSYPDARFERITDMGRGLAVLGHLDAMQRARLATKARFELDLEPWRGFYRRRLQEGLADGSCVLTALQADGEIIAAAFGVRHGTTLTMLRASFAGERWKACAPGRLLLQHTAHEQWQQGCRSFDLSIGRYAYKRSFGCTTQPLRESCTPLSGLGRLATWAWQAHRRWRAPGAETGRPDTAARCTAACE